MSIDLRKETISLKEGKTLTIMESGWDFSFRFDELEKEMQKVDTRDKVFKFFCVNYYPLLASCVEGILPSPQEAFALPREILDKWHLTTWKLNPDLYADELHKPMREEIEFRDGLKVTMEESLGRPSFVIRFYELELYAEEHPMENDERGQVFQLIFYPKLAASCVTNILPSAEEVRHWPRTEINRWMEISRRLNSDWYATPEEKVEQRVVTSEKKKKVGRLRSRGSLKGSVHSSRKVKETNSR